MDKAFARINVFRADYHWLINRFSNDEPRPAQGVLISRARDHIVTLENELDEINKVIQEGKA